MHKVMTTPASPWMSEDEVRELHELAHRLIPGGAHTYAKGDDQYPINAPPFLVRGSGCHVWDAQGREYIEYGMGLRAVGLGHAFPSVIEAAHRGMCQGLNFTRPSTLETQCAQQLLNLIPSADMVKFAKNGSDVTTAAVKLARAYTGRDRVAICADQPFFSTDDWFIGKTPMNDGIPQAIRDLTVTFRFNDIQSVRDLFAKYANEISCVLLEAATAVEPAPGFLQDLRQLCTDKGALLVLDEMITGFRWNLHGAQRVYNIVPDLSTFGKAIGNGFAVSALVGKREFMERGGLRHSHERVFLLSTTHGAETLALAAAMETMNVYENQGVIEHMYRQGERLRRGIEAAVAAERLQEHVVVLGRPCNLVYATRDQQKQPSQAFRALFLQELIRHGVIAPSLVVSFSHSDLDIDKTIDAVTQALRVYRSALTDGVEKFLVGRPVKPVFRKEN
jgi:glutamate-1-semialdehyde 2,1-aminomutase